jgi:predicted AAA+ superfamily ATPase
MQEELEESAKQFPIVTILGPRQSGKTTLVRQTFSNKPYVNMESIHVKELATSDPVAFLELYPEGAILDEIQEVPNLLSYIQVRVDESGQKGEFILTGSHQLELSEAISQSLAGRVAILHLLPLSLEELGKAGIEKSVDEILLEGCYPRVHADRLNPTKTYASYVRTYIERDIRMLLQVHNLDLFQKFIVLSASRVGQIFNKDHLAGEVGVSSKTIGHWLSILEACYIVYQLPPYFENFGKRAIKSPKIYFCDVGLVAYLLGIETVEQMSRDPLRGNLFENLVVNELMKARFNRGLDPRLYFYQVTGRNKVDLIYQQGHELIPIEIKASRTFNSSFLSGIMSFKKIIPGRCPSSYLIYSGDEEMKVQDIQLLNYRKASRVVLVQSRDKFKG